MPVDPSQVGPPLGVIVLAGILGVITLVFVVIAWLRRSRGAIRIVAGTRILSAVTALPAFFAGPPAPFVIAAAVGVTVTVIAVALMLSPHAAPYRSRAEGQEMTTTTERPSAATVRLSDTRTLGRWTAAILMPIGPAAVAVLRFVLPYDTNDSAAVMIAKVQADVGSQQAVIALGLIALFTLVPGAYAVTRLTRAGAPG